MTTRADGLLRGSKAAQAPTFLELFFDLAFVFTLTQLSHELIQHLTWNGTLQTLILLLAMMRIWITTTWMTDRLDPLRAPVQWMVSATLLGTLVLAVVLSQAFGRYGLIFAGVYVVGNVARDLFLVLVMRGHELQRVAVRTLFWSGLSVAPWIVGALVHGSAREALWALGVTIDYAGYALKFPVPGAGQLTAWEPPAAPEHLAERYRNFLIISLGELVLVSGQTFSGRGFSPDRATAFVVAIATAALLLHIYMYRAGQLLSAASTPTSNRASHWLGYVHLVMVAGIVATATGAELVIAEPFRQPSLAGGFVILGGPAVFILGHAAFECAVFTRASRDRPIGVLLLAALIPTALVLSPLLTTTTAMAVLAGIALADSARTRRHPPENRWPQAIHPTTGSG